MRCLKCWLEIEGDFAVFTKSCHHVFCERCSGRAFQKELSCPLCDTVLAKDGVGKIVLRPTESYIRKTSEGLFGLEPDKLCDILQLGLEFWATQQRNEALQHVRELKSAKARIEDVELHKHKLSKALEDERMKKKALQSEKDDLQRHVSELEVRYAEKARSMRKLSDLYGELRQVHRRLEVDLRGVRDAPEYGAELGSREVVDIGFAEDLEAMKPNIEREGSVKARHASPQRDARRGSAVGPSDKVSLRAGYNCEDGNRDAGRMSRTPLSSSMRQPQPVAAAFQVSPFVQQRPFELRRRIPNEIRKGRRRREPSSLTEEGRGADKYDAE